MKRTILLAALTLSTLVISASLADPTKTHGSHELQILSEGNRRYLAGHVRHPHESHDWRHAIARGQHPIAAVLSCADSRVPPELIFDQGLGDIFTVRVAGNVVDDMIGGSLEYAVEHLNIPLIVVLGHTSCGAVKAAIAGKPTNTRIDSLIQAIQPSVKEAQHWGGDLERHAIAVNVQHSVLALKRDDPVLSKAVKEGHVKIVGAVYDLDSGRVTFLR